MPSNDDALKELQHTLITANHILHYHRVVDAYGHISVRHPTNPSIFIMSGSVAPAIVSSPSDLIQYHISDCSPVNPDAKKGYQERFIHGEIFKKFPGVHAVVHSHAEEVLPFTFNGVGLRAVFHIGGFLGTSVPNYDITKLYQPADKRNMLVNSQTFGASLADHFASSPSPSTHMPDKAVVLMKNHGFTAVGSSIQQAVYRAVYTQVNARVQTNAILLRNAFSGAQGGGEGMEYLGEDDIEGCAEMGVVTQERPWGLWVREVEACALYVNDA